MVARNALGFHGQQRICFFYGWFGWLSMQPYYQAATIASFLCRMPVVVATQSCAWRTQTCGSSQHYMHLRFVSDVKSEMGVHMLAPYMRESFGRCIFADNVSRTTQPVCTDIGTVWL